MITLPDGPICVIGIDSKHKANFILDLKSWSSGLFMWPEVKDGIPLHPYTLRVFIETIIDSDDNIIIVTQSPIVLSCFQEIPENVYICNGTTIFELTQKFDKQWLVQSNTKIEDLYISGSLEDRIDLENRTKNILKLL